MAARASWRRPASSSTAAGAAAAAPEGSGLQVPLSLLRSTGRKKKHAGHRLFVIHCKLFQGLSGVGEATDVNQHLGRQQRRFFRRGGELRCQAEVLERTRTYSTYFDIFAVILTPAFLHLSFRLS